MASGEYRWENDVGENSYIGVLVRCSDLNEEQEEYACKTGDYNRRTNETDVIAK